VPLSRYWDILIVEAKEKYNVREVESRVVALDM
jgi:hypothetical protein